MRRPPPSQLPARILAACLALGAACANAAPERYRVDPQHTYALYEYSHWGLSIQQGRFDSVRGSITLDPQTPGGGQVEIEIDANSINAGSADFSELLRSDEYFDAANHPVILFRATRLEFRDEALVKLDGELTIKGITRPLTLTIDRYQCRFMLLYLRRACGANASASVSRSAFGLDRYTSFVGDEMTLRIAVEAIKE